MQTRPLSVAEPIQIELSKHNTCRLRGHQQALFEADLTELLKEAGCAGTYRVQGTGHGHRGSCYSQGVTIGTPCMKGVTICSQYGDNGSREDWILQTQPHESPEKLRTRLIEARDRINERKKLEKRTPAVSLVESAPAPVVDELPAPVEVAPPEKNTQRSAPFLANDDNVPLLCALIDERVGGSEVISRRVVTDLLVDQFGYGSFHGTGPVQAKLVRASILVRNDNGSYTRGDAWATSVAQVDQTPQIVEPQVAPVPYLSKIADLTQLAAQRPEFESRLGDVDASIAALEQELASRRLEREEAAAQLQSSADAAEKLEQLKALLGE